MGENSKRPCDGCDDPPDDRRWVAMTDSAGMCINCDTARTRKAFDDPAAIGVFGEELDLLESVVVAAGVVCGNAGDELEHFFALRDAIEALRVYRAKEKTDG